MSTICKKCNMVCRGELCNFHMQKENKRVLIGTPKGLIVVSENLVSNCCAADFDPLGYEKEPGIFQERCLECENICEPLMLSGKTIQQIQQCVAWNKEQV